MHHSGDRLQNKTMTHTALDSLSPKIYHIQITTCWTWK